MSVPWVLPAYGFQACEGLHRPSRTRVYPFVPEPCCIQRDPSITLPDCTPVLCGCPGQDRACCSRSPIYLLPLGTTGHRGIFPYGPASIRGCTALPESLRAVSQRRLGRDASETGGKGGQREVRYQREGRGRRCQELRDSRKRRGGSQHQERRGRRWQDGKKRKREGWGITYRIGWREENAAAFHSSGERQMRPVARLGETNGHRRALGRNAALGLNGCRGHRIQKSLQKVIENGNKNAYNRSGRADWIGLAFPG